MEPEGSESEEFREMTLWHCGLSKWYIYMQQLHASNFKTFFYILKKTNLHHIKQNNVNHMHEHATFMYSLPDLDNFRTDWN